MLDGVALSIYDGETEYRIGQTVLHPHGDDHAGGLYVSDTIEGCLRRDANLFPTEVRAKCFPRLAVSVSTKHVAGDVSTPRGARTVPQATVWWQRIDRGPCGTIPWCHGASAHR